MLSEMLLMRSKENDCRIKGFVIEITGDIKDKVKSFEKQGIRFDLIMGVGVKNDFLEEWGYCLKNGWMGVNKVWIEEHASDTTPVLVEKMVNQLYYVDD